MLLQVPGGAWAISEKRGQAVPLLSRMVELGWICVTINYSRSPGSPWPAHIIDVKRAIAWVRENIADYGGDPDFIALTGGSAGAHVGSLAALTANDPALQPGFEDADTSVQAAVPYYGAYDLTDATNMCDLMLPFLEQFVMQGPAGRQPGAVREPRRRSTHVHRDAPPFFVLHGSNDAVIPQHPGADVRRRRFGRPAPPRWPMPSCPTPITPLTRGDGAIADGADTVADFLGVTYGRHRTRAAEVVDTAS